MTKLEFSTNFNQCEDYHFIMILITRRNKVRAVRGIGGYGGWGRVLSTMPLGKSQERC